MDDAQKKDVLAKLLKGRKNYAEQLPAKINKIREVWGRLTQGAWDIDQFRTFHRMVHTIAGSAGTFGLPDVGLDARKLEILLKSLLESGQRPAAEEEAAVRQGLERLEETAEISLKKGAAPLAPLPHPKNAPVNAGTDDKLIFLVEDDLALAKEAAVQIGHYGYRVKTFPDLKAFRAGLAREEPMAVIMDIQLPDGDGSEEMARVQKERDAPLPVLFMTVLTDLPSRLKAVAAGGTAYFTKPLNITEMVDTLDALCAVDESEPFRILIVEDSRSLARHFSLVLEQAGMETVVVTDPLQVMKPLNDFRPDLILMDLYMPGCTGLDLAKVIRQQPAFVSIPIVYLSGETDLDKQLQAMSLGGDDFLTKPIEPDHLVLAITSRVKRAGALKGLMIRDGLTGLYNHTNTKEQLDLEVERAKRADTPLTFAMVDMDKFKLVNDTYGHPTGDRVIKSLARLLRQRLRKTDIVGRYGGEEFAVILPDTEATTALRILNELRVSFGKVQHQHDAATFTKTFSCGVATFPNFESGAALSDAADKALYAAKKGGRNRVELARD